MYYRCSLSKHTMSKGPLQILLPGVCPFNRLIHIKIGPKQILCMKSALLYCVRGVYTPYGVDCGETTKLLVIQHTTYVNCGQMMCHSLLLSLAWSTFEAGFLPRKSVMN